MKLRSDKIKSILTTFPKENESDIENESEEDMDDSNFEIFEKIEAENDGEEDDDEDGGDAAASDAKLKSKKSSELNWRSTDSWVYNNDIGCKFQLLS